MPFLYANRGGGFELAWLLDLPIPIPLLGLTYRIR
jgi:hypothetical protein